MATGISQDKIVKALKKHGTADKLPSMQKMADELGIALGAAGAIVWPVEPIAFPSLKFTGTPAAIVEARDKKGLRWERIAAYTGKSVSEVKKIYAEKTGNDPSASYTGRGRNFSGTTTTSGSTRGTGRGAGRSGKAASKKTASAGRGTSGRRAAAKTKSASTAGRGASKKTSSAGRGAGRRAADPS